MIPTNKLFIGINKGLTAIICGSAPCLLDDYKYVITHLKGGYRTIGVNEAVYVLYCDYLMTAHPELLDVFKGLSINKNLETHTSRGYHPDKRDKADYFWPDIKGGATSGIDAVQIAQRMGFDRIILVGCPMNGGDGYFHADNAPDNIDGCPRFGNKGNEHLVSRHQVRLADIIKEGDFSNVSSMNGYTAKIFGKTEF
jgi:hypothetical protein